MRDDEPRPYTEHEVASQIVQMLAIIAVIMLSIAALVGLAWVEWSVALATVSQ